MSIAKDFWNTKHTTNNKNSLTGSSFDKTVDTLRIQDRIREGLTVLEVGSGLGYVTNRLAQIGSVSVVDVSEVALDRVKDICELTYLSDDTDRLPDNYFDLIICNNVVQHVPTVELKRELADFIRSLRPNGLFALQFVSADEGSDHGVEFTPKQLKAGLLCRDSAFIGNLITELGARYTEVYTAAVNVPPITGTHVFHITKNV